ncbi:MAG: retroviral-like aspartic protease family protein [Dehalococcoidia bacterium]|nr:retroviral-like aspartic protease family protein [Dehalococcoidia bacterium]
MGTFSVSIQVGDVQGMEFEELTALVDTGATTTVIPASILHRLGVTPAARRTFEYASGEEVELDMAEIKVRVEGRETGTWAVFGNDNTGALLGAYTLEGVFLGVDPYNRRLIPVQGILK